MGILNYASMHVATAEEKQCGVEALSAVSSLLCEIVLWSVIASWFPPPFPMA